MAVIYTNNFDADTVGALPAGWTAFSGTWAVSTVSPVSAPNTLRCTSDLDAELIRYTGAGSISGDASHQIKFKIVDGTNQHAMYPGVHFDATNTRGYLMEVAFVGGVVRVGCLRRASSAYTVLGLRVTTSIPATIGTTLGCEIKRIGSTIEIRVWDAAGARPSTPTNTYTDANFNDGYPILYNSKGAGSTGSLGVDDVVIEASATAAANTTLTGPTSGTTGVPSADFTVGADGIITGSVVCTPSDGGAGGTFNPTTVTISSGSPSGTFKYTPASAGAKTISLANNGSLGTPTPITYTASSAGATAVTLTGPTSGTVGVPSTNFTVAADGVITGTVTVTPSDAGAGGSFSPTSVALSSGTPSATFTYTPSTAGAKTISVGNNGGLTAPTPITFTAAGSSVIIPVTNTALFFSPYNTISDGAGSMQANNVKASSTYALWNMRGSYLKFKATVGASGSIALNVDCSSLAGLANAAGAPNLLWSVGGLALQTLLLATATTKVTLATGLAAGTYEVQVAHKSVYITMDGGDAANYSALTNVVKITSVELSAGGTVAASDTLRSDYSAHFGDSITEGDRSVANTRSGASQDATQVYGVRLADALGCECGIIGFYGKNWSFFNGSWANYSNGSSRLVGGLLVPPPKYITVNYGENAPLPTAGEVTTTMAALSAAAPNAKIALMVPFSGKGRANLLAATLPANVKVIDLARPEMLPGSLAWSADGQHPDLRGHSTLGALTARAVNVAFPASASVPSVAGITAGVALTATGQLVPVIA